MSSSREAQRRYRSKQKAKLEDLRVEVDSLKSKLVELDLKRAGLASQNRILEETAAAVQAKKEKEANVDNRPQKLWDERAGKCLAEFFNNLKADSLVVEMGPEEGRMLSTSELILLLQEFYTQLTEIMTSSEPDSVKSRRVARLITAKGEMRHALEFMGPKCTALLQMGIESSSKLKNIPPPSKALVQQGLDSLQLSNVQKQELMTGKNKLLRRFAEIKEERIEIIQRIHEVIERDRDKGDEHQSAMTLLEEIDATEELKRNLNSEHTCFFRFQSELHETLSPLQFAKALALKQMNGVSMWAMLQLLTEQDPAMHGDLLFLDQPNPLPADKAGVPPVNYKPATSNLETPPSEGIRGSDSTGGQEPSQNSSETSSLLNGPTLYTFQPNAENTAHTFAGSSRPEESNRQGYQQQSKAASGLNLEFVDRAGYRDELPHDQMQVDSMLLDMPDPLGLNFEEAPDYENDQHLWNFFQEIFSDNAA